MSEDTRQTMEACLEDLRGQGTYKRHFSDDVVLEMMGTDQEARGPGATEQFIDYMHRQAFEARPEIKSMVVGDNQAAAEFDFVGRHTGEFAGIPAMGRVVGVPYCVVYELEGERVKALRLYFAMEVLMQRPGTSPAPEQSEEASPT